MISEPKNRIRKGLLNRIDHDISRLTPNLFNFSGSLGYYRLHRGRLVAIGTLTLEEFVDHYTDVDLSIQANIEKMFEHCRRDKHRLKEVY